jgi:AAA+ ATPase superfamily predicted ATPase
MKKPGTLFDREWEWGELARFTDDKRSGITLGIVSGRRRQGKSWLLHALTEATGGFYYEAIDGSESEIVRDLGVKLATFTQAPAPFAFSTMEQALAALVELGTRGRSTTVVLDEFPALAAANPAAPSILRNILGPGGPQRNRSRTRLLLCGSALHFMGGLLAGQSPLRGRAGIELVVPSFDFRMARQFWGIRDLALAVKVFSIVGGTPAYRREFVADNVPRGPKDFDAWVSRTALNPAVPLFREARYLLAEDPAIGDLGLYQSVLSAIAHGETTSAKIAGRLGRPATALAHPLNVLADAGFVEREQDPFHEKRVHYTIIEPIVTFHHAILRPAWSDLERPGRATQVWRRSKPTFEARVLGPAFESLCRTWARQFAEPETFGSSVKRVARGLVPDASEHRTHEVDVVVLGDDDRILAIGEAKWAESMGDGDLQRLHRIATLLATRGYDTRDTRFALFSGAGFSAAFRSRREAGGCVLVDLKRIYGVG